MIRGSCAGWLAHAALSLSTCCSFTKRSSPAVSSFASALHGGDVLNLKVRADAQRLLVLKYLLKFSAEGSLRACSTC